MRRYDEAIQAYETGLKIEDSPALRKGLKEVVDAKQADERGDGAEAIGLGKLFGDPEMFAKLAANPRTAKHLADPAFVQKLQAFQQNPKLAENAFQADPRMIDVLGALMGLDMQGFTREEGSDELPPGVQRADGPSSPKQPQASSPPPKKEEPPKQEEDVEMAEPEEDAEAKKEAEEEKKKGAEAYKTRDFDNAIVHFQKAWDVYPKDITFLTNLAGESCCSRWCSWRSN
ncbi:hypothetical protein OH77DRAFT_224639 [Trametes cingulata]|nr:hypothetical protein OH77DRAFT_224639 [Trametes cingulata]